MPTVQPTGRAVSAGRIRSAFTLFEILVALGVVVALLGVAVPVLLLSFDARRIEAQAETLAAAVGSLRAEAVRARTSLALYLVPAENEWGSQLVLGPLSSDESSSDWDSGAADESAAWPDPLESDAFRERVIFRASRPYRLSIQMPTAGPDLGGYGGAYEAGYEAGGVGQGVEEAASGERVRIAAISASGQVLASRPLWCSDDERMFSVEVGLGIGNAVLSGVRNIPDQAPEEEDEQGDDREPEFEDETADGGPNPADDPEDDAMPEDRP